MHLEINKHKEFTTLQISSYYCRERHFFLHFHFTLFPVAFSVILLHKEMLHQSAFNALSIAI